MNPEPLKDDFDARFADDELIGRALTAATREALRHHKLAGNPIAVWRDGQVVWIPAEEIDVEGNGGNSAD